MLAVLAVTLTATLLMDFRVGLQPLSPGIDAAYFYAFHRAIVAGLRWGRDFVSTYGPYGYLIVAYDVGPIAERRLAFEAVRAGVAALSVTAFVSTLPEARPWKRVTWGIGLCWALALQAPEYRWLGPVLIGLAAAVHLTGVPRITAQALIACLAGFLLLVKGSIGGAAVLGTIAAGAFGPRRIRAAAVGTAGVSLGVAGAWLAYEGTPAGLWSHIVLLREIGAGYSSAMSVDRGNPAQIGWFLASVSLLLAGLALARSRRAWAVFGVSAVSLFAVWKHGFVRQDDHHTPAVVSFGLLFALLLLAQAWTSRARPAGIALLGLAPLCLAPLWGSGTLNDASLRTLGDELRAPWAGRGLEQLRLLGDFGSYRRRLADRSRQLLSSVEQPPRLKRIVGDGSIDVYPWEVSLAAANPELHWRLRPSPASFGSYTPALDRLNAAFFEAPTRPAFLLWHWRGQTSLNARHLFWDEPHTLRALLDGYDLVDEGLVLLAARATPRYAGERELAKARVAWREWTHTPVTKNPVLLQVRLGPSLLRSATRVLFRENPAWIELRFASGRIEGFRFVPDHAASGLWLDPLPVRGEEVAAVLRDQTLPDRVSAIRLIGPWSLERTGFLGLTWLELVPSAGAE